MKNPIDDSCRAFTEALASSAPAPGGGGAAALAGAIGTALDSMVISLTAGKKKYAAVEGEMRALLEECRALREKLLDQVKADEEGFLPLAEAYGIPKDDPSREEKLENASRSACRVPMEIMRLCRRGIDISAVLAEKGSRLMLSDAGCAAAILSGALRAASLNVFVNTRAYLHTAWADACRRECGCLLTEGTAAAERVFLSVKDQLERRSGGK